MSQCAGWTRPSAPAGTALAALVAAALGGAPAHATDGYFPHGYGMKSLGEGGASIARTDDAFGGANNPAQFAFVADRIDLGLNWFSPTRSAERSGSTLPAAYGNLDGRVDSGSNSFYIPEFGASWKMREDLGLGVSVYGNGGMNTDYPQGPFRCPTQNGPVASNMLCGQGSLGIDLEQLVVAPALAWRFASGQSLGAAPLLTEQRFKATGLQAFAGTPGFSSAPADVTDQGYAYSSGLGLRLGYLWQAGDAFSFGATYAIKTSMRKFDKYQGLFAGQGNFDLPANYGAGIAWRPAAGWTLLADYERILYAGVASVGDPSTAQAQLGASGGPGFGWKDINVYKLGLQYAASPVLTLRAGYNHSDNPIGPGDVTFNILAPGVITNHYTLGATVALPESKSEITVALAYMPANSVTGSSYFNALFQSQGLPAGSGGTETIRMSEKEAGIAWGLHF